MLSLMTDTATELRAEPHENSDVVCASSSSACATSRLSSPSSPPCSANASSGQVARASRGDADSAWSLLSSSIAIAPNLEESPRMIGGGTAFLSDGR